MHLPDSLPTTLEHEVLVVGAGPAGLATALRLTQRGIDTLLVERNRFDSARIGEHLSPNGLAALDRLDVSFESLAVGHFECPHVTSLWGSTEAGGYDYIFSPYGSALNLTRPEFDNYLSDLLIASGGHVIYECRFRKLDGRPGDWKVLLSSAGTLLTARANFLVDATGRSAAIASSLGAKRMTYDRLTGISGYMEQKANSARDGLVGFWTESTRDGWWYGAKLMDRRMAVSFMTDMDIPRGSVRSVNLWTNSFLHSSMGQLTLNDYTLTKDVVVRSARTHRLGLAASDGWIAVGDAAMALDPLSSAGVAKGLDHGVRAAEMIYSFFSHDTYSAEEYNQFLQVEFVKYLEERAHNYRLEDRWSDEAFWSRRQRALPWERSVSLAPESILRPGNVQVTSSERDNLAIDFPGLDYERVHTICNECFSAYEVVQRYQKGRVHTLPDRFVIAGLDELVDLGILLCTGAFNPPDSGRRVRWSTFQNG